MLLDLAALTVFVAPLRGNSVSRRENIEKGFITVRYLSDRFFKTFPARINARFCGLFAKFIKPKFFI
jgi:hypothetical protein